MKIEEANSIGTLILKVLRNIGDSKIEKEVKEEVLDLTSRFPVPGIAS
jgi:glycine/serine hydroxymethyltransferase